MTIETGDRVRLTQDLLPAKRGDVGVVVEVRPTAYPYRVKFPVRDAPLLVLATEVEPVLADVVDLNSKTEPESEPLNWAYYAQAARIAKFLSEDNATHFMDNLAYVTRVEFAIPDDDENETFMVVRYDEDNDDYSIERVGN